MPSAISKPNNKNQNPKKLFAFAHIQLPNAISHLKTQQQKPKSKKIVCFRTHSIAKCHQPSQNPTTKTKIQKNCLLSHTFNCQMPSAISKPNNKNQNPKKLFAFAHIQLPNAI